MSRRDEHELGVLSEARCFELLAKQSFGRLAFWSDDMPLILSVNYVFEKPSIVVRTGPGVKFEQTPMARVAFEIDEADPLGRWGWSVVAQGHSFDITSSLDHRSEALRKLAVTPWAPGDKPSWLDVSATRVSGRYFGNPPS